MITIKYSFIYFFTFLLFYSCTEKIDTNRNKLILNDLNQFSFEYIIDTIGKLEKNEICHRSNIYYWENLKKIKLKVGIYKEYCFNKVGVMPTLNDEKIILNLLKDGFLLNNHIKYPFDSLKIILASDLAKNEIFLDYPFKKKIYNFSPFLDGLRYSIDKNQTTIDSLPVFYFLDPLPLVCN